MKMPATTEGVPLMAVTTVRTVREPNPAHLVEVDGRRHGEGHAERHGDEHLLEGADDGVEDADVGQGVRVGDLEVLLVLGEQGAPVDGRDGLPGHPHHDEQHDPDDEEGRADTTTTPTTRSVATCRSTSWAVPSQMSPRKVSVPGDEEAEPAREGGELVEDDPHEAQRRDGGGPEDQDVLGAEGRRSDGRRQSTGAGRGRWSGGPRARRDPVHRASGRRGGRRAGSGSRPTSW